MFSGVGSFRADPLRFNTGNAGGAPKPVEQPASQGLFKSSSGANELTDVNNLFGTSIFPPEDRPAKTSFVRANAGSTGSPEGNGNRPEGDGNRNVALDYVSNYFQTNPAGKQVKVRPPEPPLFGTYE